MQNIQLISKLEVLNLVRDANIEQLQRDFSGFQQQLETDQTELPLTRALLHYPSETRSGLKVARLWLERFPDSYPAHLVLGNCLFAEGGAKRGTAFADKVSEYGWQGFYEGVNASWLTVVSRNSVNRLPITRLDPDWWFVPGRFQFWHTRSLARHPR